MRCTAALLNACLLLLAMPALAEGENSWQEVFPTETIEYGTPAYANFTSTPGYSTGYLVVKTENEVGVARLQLSVYEMLPNSTRILLAAANITTETVTAYLLGSSATAGEGIVQVGPFELHNVLRIKFSVHTTEDTSFDVTAGIDWVVD